MQTHPSPTGPGALLAALAPTSTATPGAADASAGSPAGLSFVEHLGRSTAAGAALLEAALAEAANLPPVSELGCVSGLISESDSGRIEPMQAGEPNATVPAGLDAAAAGGGPLGEFAGLHELLAQLLTAAPPAAAAEAAQAQGTALEAASHGRAALLDAVPLRHAALRGEASLAADGAAQLGELPPTARQGAAAVNLGDAVRGVARQAVGEAAMSAAASPATTPAAVSVSPPAGETGSAPSGLPTGTEAAPSRRLSGESRPGQTVPGQATVRGDVAGAVRGAAHEASRPATRLSDGNADADPNATLRRADRTESSSTDVDPAASGASGAAAAQAPAIADARAVSELRQQDPRADVRDASMAAAPATSFTPVPPPWAGTEASTTNSRPSGRTGGDLEPRRLTATALPSEAARPASDTARPAPGERTDERRDSAERERTGGAPSRAFAPARFDADAAIPTPWSMAPPAAGAAPAEAPRVNAPAESALPLAAPAMVGTLPAAPLAAPGAAPLHIEVAAPVQDSRFTETFALQVSKLAHDGVRHAVLHLNPAEMGPISVQIALDGQQAQIHFGCDSAQTRGIVESGLPLLAASLREAGLTLSGGGVSQHAPEQRQESNPGGAQHARRFNVEPDAGAALRTLRVSAGRLDTYA
jgi:flagellar hook-length control protein FliK